MCSKADGSQLNLWHRTKKNRKNKEWKLKIKPICSTVAVLSTVCGVSPESLRWEEFVTRS